MAVVILVFVLALATSCTAGSEPCRDFSTLCSQLIRYCNDEVHGDWMDSHCAKSCHVCQENCVKACTRDYKPICGSDGKTYGNKCMFEIGQCENPSLKEKHGGECKDEEATTPAPPPPPPKPTQPPQPPQPEPEKKMTTIPPPPPEPEAPTGEPVVGVCGLPQIAGDRIVGGKAAVPGSWPWQILLLYAGYPSCGGSIVSAEWIVTAAHCVFMMENYTNEFTIRTGEYNREELEGPEREYDVAKIIVHAGYNPYNLNNDIALIKVKAPIMMDKYRSPVCLPSKPPKVGTTCYITGWGKMKYTSHMVNILQQGKLPVVSQETCHDLNLKNIGIPVTDAMICGGSGGTSVLSGCHGDSGGPYVCEEGGRWFLQGAVSHGSPRCNSTETYTVFARITHFRKWIDLNMRTN